MHPLSRIHNRRNVSAERVEDFGAYIDSFATGFSFSCSYALDVNTERAEDVLVHKKLLNMARDPLTRPAVDVRLVQVYPRILHDSVQLSLPLMICRSRTSLCLIVLHDYATEKGSTVCGGHEKMVFHVIPMQ